MQPFSRQALIRAFLLALVGVMVVLPATAAVAKEVTVTAEIPRTTEPLSELLSVSSNTPATTFGTAKGSFTVTNVGDAPVLFRGVIAASGYDVEGALVPEQLLRRGESTTIPYSLSGGSRWGRVSPQIDLTYPDGSSSFGFRAQEMTLISAQAAPTAIGSIAAGFLLFMLVEELRIALLRIRVRRLSAQTV